MALRLLAQAMLIVAAGTSWGTPASQATCRATFGPPSGIYRVDGFIVVVWDKNLLSHLGTAAMHGPIQC